jgi:hypothetical protein
MDDPELGVRFSAQAIDFSRLHKFQTDYGVNLVSYTKVIGAFHPGVRRLVFEDDHSSPSSAEAKNCGVIPPIPQTILCCA